MTKENLYKIPKKCRSFSNQIFCIKWRFYDHLKNEKTTYFESVPKKLRMNHLGKNVIVPTKIVVLHDL